MLHHLHAGGEHKNKVLSSKGLHWIVSPASMCLVQCLTLPNHFSLCTFFVQSFMQTYVFVSRICLSTAWRWSRRGHTDKAVSNWKCPQPALFVSKRCGLRLRRFMVSGSRASFCRAALLPRAFWMHLDLVFRKMADWVVNPHSATSLLTPCCPLAFLPLSHSDTHPPQWSILNTLVVLAACPCCFDGRFLSVQV